MIAPVNKIIPLSTVDGLGARTAIFLQGCNIACIYCHNPETQHICIGCGICVKICPQGALSFEGGMVKWREDLCVDCDSCIRACPHFASPKIKIMTPEQVMDKVRQNTPFIRGITVSGGECTLYPDFLTELFTLAKAEGLDCLIDSNGTLDFARYPDLLEVCDGVMLDVKAWSTKMYASLTCSVDNTIVKQNLTLLAQKGLLEEIGVVCIDGEMDAEAVISGVAYALGNRVGDIRLKLITFRNNGVRGRLERTSSPTKETMLELRNHAKQLGFNRLMLV